MNRLAKYTRAFSLGLQNGLEYRMDFFLNLASVVFQIFIQVFLWSEIYRQTGQGQMFGYTYPQMILYTVLAGLLNRLSRTGFEYEIAEDIKGGGLSKFIVKPVHYFSYRLAAFLGQKTAQTGLISLVLLATTAIVSHQTGLPVGIAQVFAFLPVFLLSFFLNFLLFYLASTLAFWLSEIGFFFEAVRIVFIALSGGIFPLAVLGARAEAILGLLPFRYTISFPVEALTGRLSGGEYQQGLLIQIVWISVLAIAASRFWRQGMRKFIAAGG
jgi:ABC-2 type transport system permease protein